MALDQRPCRGLQAGNGQGDPFHPFLESLGCPGHKAHFVVPFGFQGILQQLAPQLLRQHLLVAYVLGTGLHNTGIHD